MTLFNAANNSQTSTDDQTKEVKVEDLVGEGKKFKDVAALAKGKAESDAFIEQLKSELAGMRQELNSRLSLEEAVEQIKAFKPTSTPRVPDEEEPTSQAQTSAVDIENIVNNKILETQQKLTAERNIEFVKSELEKNWGPNYAVKLRNIAKELGETEDSMGQAAARNPKAFLRLVGGEKQTQQTQEPSVSPPRSQMTLQPSPTNAKNSAYYAKLRRDNPKEYWLPKTQVEMHKEALRQGESFFNT
jgi:hypothetical protein